MAFPIASSIPRHSLPYVTGNLRSSASDRSQLGMKGRRTLGASFNNGKSMDFTTVENEYIRNLQQQIYFLELECEHLREQAKKVITVPSSVTFEAERMIKKIKSELRGKEQCIVQRDSTISVLQHDKINTMSKLELAEESFSSEKKELVNEIVSLRKQVERHELDAAKRQTDSVKMKSDLYNTLLNMKESDNRINILKQEVEEKTEQYNKLRIAYEEKRAECLKAQTEFQELEERFFHSKATSRKEVDHELKTELKNFRYDLREKELQAEQDRTLRLKISDDCAALVKENAALSSQIIELQKQLDVECRVKNEGSMRKQANITELITLKEERKHLERELERLKEQVYIEQQKYRKLLEKFTYEEESHTRAKLQRSKLKAELEELESIESAESQENVNLRRDKLLLTDQVAELKEKLRDKNEQSDEMQAQYQDLQVEYTELGSKLRFQSSFDQIKWEEFERMADQMKKFSRSMSPIRNPMSNTSLNSKVVDIDS